MREVKSLVPLIKKFKKLEMNNNVKLESDREKMKQDNKNIKDGREMLKKDNLELKKARKKLRTDSMKPKKDYESPKRPRRKSRRMA